ncbi:hypothetical protein [Pseudonocardia adelaidensis]
MPDALEPTFHPIDRMLLTADGTATSFLKACTASRSPPRRRARRAFRL